MCVGFGILMILKKTKQKNPHSSLSFLVGLEKREAGKEL